jgi:hypothetical protein
MNRRDARLDAVLRHLGTAFYDSLHGRAAPADVARALDSVAGQVGEKLTEQPTAAGSSVARRNGSAGSRERHGRWHSRVQDVMTASVVTVDRITPYKEIARRLAERKVGGVPVLTMGQHVVGSSPRATCSPRGIRARRQAAGGSAGHRGGNGITAPWRRI